MHIGWNILGWLKGFMTIFLFTPSIKGEKTSPFYLTPTELCSTSQASHLELGGFTMFLGRYEASVSASMILTKSVNPLQGTGLKANESKTTQLIQIIFSKHFWDFWVMWVSQSSHICCSGKARLFFSFKEFQGSLGNLVFFVKRSHYFLLLWQPRDKTHNLILQGHRCGHRSFISH